MNVTVLLYSNKSDPFVVHKKLTLVKTCTCQITDSVDVDELDLELDMDSSLNTCNYAHIDRISNLTSTCFDKSQFFMHYERIRFI